MTTSTATKCLRVPDAILIEYTTVRTTIAFLPACIHSTRNKVNTPRTYMLCPTTTSAVYVWHYPLLVSQACTYQCCFCQTLQATQGTSWHLQPKLRKPRTHTSCCSVVGRFYSGNTSILGMGWWATFPAVHAGRGLQTLQLGTFELWNQIFRIEKRAV